MEQIKLRNQTSKLATLVGVSLLAFASFQGKAQEEKQEAPKVNASLKGEWFNKYIFRDTIYSENPITQGTALINYRDFTLGLTAK